jgi:hypothetical protein
MPMLKYDGPLPRVEVGGYGHFAPGDEKSVDTKTAIDFDCQPCMDEGWSVTFEGNEKRATSADTETIEPARNDAPRGPRTRKDND